MTVLSFDQYHVLQMFYQRNENFKSTLNKISLTPKIKQKVAIKGNQVKVTLTAEVGTLDKKNVPFKAGCSVSGIFTYRAAEDNANVGIDALIRNNAVAILYPYIRSIIAFLTTSSNEFPGYNLPTINVSQILAQDENIN